MTKQAAIEIREKINLLLPDLKKHMEVANTELISILSEDKRSYNYPRNHFFNLLDKDTRRNGENLCARMLALCGMVASEVQSCVLTGPEDLNDIKIATKTIKSSMRFNEFYYHEQSVIHDEGQILGLQPATQQEGDSIWPYDAHSKIWECLTTIASVLKMVEAYPEAIKYSTSTQESPNLAKYRHGTAFIMMWMNPERHELDDTVDTVREVFSNFGIRAVRADDIEHEGKITERILNDIRSSEFLFADLTGERPNVYYEVGFAHALGKRVILFRKSGTGIHFDLAGYNCPEYSNMRDLKVKLTKRLTEITNKSPQSGE